MLGKTTLLSGTSLTKMREKNLRIGVLHAGGPASGGNTVLYAAAQRAKDYGLTVVGFKNGYRELMTLSPKDILDSALIIGCAEIRYLRDQAGLVIGTDRANPGKAIASPEDFSDSNKIALLVKVLDNLEACNIGALITLGGDDTMTTASKLQTALTSLMSTGQKAYENIQGLVHVPKTIDKDYKGIDFTYGYMTAAETIGQSIKHLHDDAKATGTKHKMVAHICEVMGRKAGWLTAAAAINGQATFTIVPEDYQGRSDLNIAELARDCVDVILTRQQQGKYYSVIAIAEGLGDLIPKAEATRDEHGHIRLDEVEIGEALKEAILAELSRREGEHNIKLTAKKLGYEARQVRPNLYDQLLCQQLGVSAVDAVVQGLFAHMVSVEGVFDRKYVPFSELINPRTLRAENWTMDQNSGLYQLLRAMEQPFERNVGLKEPEEAEAAE